MTQAIEPAWHYIPLADYATPKSPVAEAAHKGLKTLWRRFRSVAKDESMDGEVVQKSSIDFYNQLFRSPDWSAPARALAEYLAKDPPERRLHVIVGGPHRATADSLRQVATLAGWRILESPGLMVDATFESIQAALTSEETIVIPQLAHWYLRHQDGMDTMRRLIDWLVTSQSRAILGCHSWAWAFLDKAMNIKSAFPGASILAPAGEQELKAWFGNLGIAQPGIKTAVREAHSGKLVMSLGDASQEDQTDHEDSSTLLAHISAASRGIPEIAVGLWREGIFRFKREMLADSARKVAKKNGEQTIWMPAWTQLDLPEVPVQPDHLQLFTLYNLLIHAGLPEAYLPLVMPFGLPEIRRCLRELEGHSLAFEEDGRWRITSQGYPSVRGTLNSEGFLVDEL